MLNQEKGSALISVLVVLFILITAFFTIYSFAISRIGFINKDINILRASYLADAGINRLLYSINSDSLTWSEILPLKINERISDKESYKVSTSLLGSYLLIESIGKIANKEITKKALVGIMPNTDLNSAIINHSTRYPLVVAGRTDIHGDVIVGPESVVSGSIEGRAFHGKELVNGVISQKQYIPKPEIDESVLEYYLDDLSEKAENPSRYIIGSAVIREPKDIPDDFSAIVIEENLEINSLVTETGLDPIRLIAGGNINIKGNCRIKGLFEIVSNEFIIIEQGAVLENVTLFAKDSIIFKNQVIFTGQALSKHKINVSDSVQILYPSLLYTFNNNENDSCLICFNKNSYSQAISISYDIKSKFVQQRNNLLIDTNAVVEGFVYSHQYSDIKGALLGTSETQSYYFHKVPTTYVNWLDNVYINRNRLGFLPILPVSFPNTNGYAVFNLLEE